MASTDAAPSLPTEEPPFEASSFEHALAQRQRPRWIGWRRRLLVAVVLAGCLALLLVIKGLAQSPLIDAQWQTGPHGQPVLQATDDARLAPQIGRSLVSLQAGPHTLALPPAPAGAWPWTAPRWTVDDALRAQQVDLRGVLNQVLAEPGVTLSFNDGAEVQVAPQRRGLRGLGIGFWALASPALMLFMVAAVVVLAKPVASNGLYALMACCQALNLLWIGIESGSLMTWVPPLFVNDLPWRLGLDLATAAAAVNAFALYPRRLPKRVWIGAGAWAIAAVALVVCSLGAWPGLWWWGQGALVALGMSALWVLHLSYREEPNPFARVLRRFGVAALGTMLVVNAAIVAAGWNPAFADGVVTAAVLVWSLFIASLTVLVPFLSRERRVLRELAMLAGLSAVATSLDLLFVSLFSLEPFASLTLAVFIALAAYAATRQWLLDQMVGSRIMTIERTFENLYRVARELQKRPERRTELLTQLLREVFDPVEVVQVAQRTLRSRVLDNGSAMVVAVRGLEADRAVGETASLVFRFARQGRRLFTREDARLTDRIVEQLRRAVAYDRAVEHGRTEERQRIAQDLHDDIGARLLTLMYKAPDPEMEDYLRQTLKDLKTLTRGLAASQHRLSHAVAEWKADAQQRLTAAHIALSWSFTLDEDAELTVVQWSGLTRILRELISNAIHHANATQLDVDASVGGGNLLLSVADDGVGQNPAGWSHGLGLGGVRKRVKQMGGDVQWRENSPSGIRCEVRIPGLLRQD